VITKNVDVIGSPTGILHLPFLTLPYNTTPLMPYFLSALDAVHGRSGVAESVRLETFNPLGETIGTLYDHWAYEFPRDMSVDNNNDYKASVSIGLHAADLVTNLSPLHVIHTTTNDCGDHCVADNVISETSETHEIWQEIYPNDHHVALGESDALSLTPLHQDDIDAGGGNYLFALWRHYQGCIPGPGHVIAVVGPHVPSPTKR
jgi:integrating conjugative element protein (TIGR03756 family)